MPRHKLVEVPPNEDVTSEFPSLRHFCSEFHAASNLCIEKSLGGDVQRTDCEPLFKAYKECKKRLSEFRLKYDQGKLELDQIPRKDGQMPPPFP